MGKYLDKVLNEAVGADHGRGHVLAAIAKISKLQRSSVVILTTLEFQTRTESKSSVLCWPRARLMGAKCFDYNFWFPSPSKHQLTGIGHLKFALQEGILVVVDEA